MDEEILEEFRKYLFLRHLRDRTVREYVFDARYLIQNNVFSSRDNLIDFFVNLKKLVLNDDLSGKRYNNLITSLTHFVRFGLPRGYVPEWVELELKQIKRIPASKIKILNKDKLVAYSFEEKKKILKNAKPGTERTIFWMALNTGLRRMELIRLKLDHVSVDGVQVTADVSKTSRPRFVPFVHPSQKEVIRSYLNYRNIMETDSDYFFVSPRGKRLAWEGGAGSRVYKRLSRACGFRVALHQCRYTFAVDLWKQTSDLPLIQYLLGHSDPKQTIEYLKLRPLDLISTIREKLGGVRFS